MSSGRARNGTRWFDRELATLFRLAPNYEALEAALPRHTRSAIQKKARRLGFARPLHVWKTTEVALLGRLWAAGASMEKIRAALPFASKVAITNQVQFNGFLRPPRRRQGSAGIIDAELQRRGMSLRDLDAKCRSGRYFATRAGYQTVWRYLGRAATVLNLAVDVVWKD